MKAKVIGKCDGELDCKRLYLPGITIEVPCRTCGSILTIDMEHEYLSYPAPEEEKLVSAYCPECDSETNDNPYTSVGVKLNVSLDIVKVYPDGR